MGIRNIVVASYTEFTWVKASEVFKGYNLSSPRAHNVTGSIGDRIFVVSSTRFPVFLTNIPMVSVI